MQKQIAEKIVRAAKKVYKLKFIFKHGEKIYNRAYAIYSHFPKYDKITGIDTDKLVMAHMNKKNQQQSL
jgi:hypothetical protein